MSSDQTECSLVLKDGKFPSSIKGTIQRTLSNSCINGTLEIGYDKTQ